MEIDSSKLDVAYRKLKSHIYYDKTDLHLRHRLARFECSAYFSQRLEDVLLVVNSPSPSKHPKFLEWISKVSYRVSPKRILWSPAGDNADGVDYGKFISNAPSNQKIEIEKVNYFFDGPIELHLISVLWIMDEGRFLDAGLDPACCGSRLTQATMGEGDETIGLFRKYHEQYSKWRDSGLKAAKHLLAKEKRNVSIIGLDLQEYFYRVRIDFDAVSSEIQLAKEGSEEPPFDSEKTCHYLTSCIQSICKAYRRRVGKYLNVTHPDIGTDDTGLPIGISFSSILANWYLKDFDSQISQLVRPSYYGRYVDDILIVIPTPTDPANGGENPVSAFVKDIFIDAGVLGHPKNGRYELTSRPGLFLQQSKCILQYFNADHSIAGLEKFQKKLEKNGSDFALMPVEEADSSLEDVAYELLYEGSINKFRSVKGMAENRYELAKHLARQTILHLYTNDPPNPDVSLELRRL